MYISITRSQCENYGISLWHFHSVFGHAYIDHTFSVLIFLQYKSLTLSQCLRHAYVDHTFSVRIFLQQGGWQRMKIIFWGGWRFWDFSANISDTYWTCQTNHRIIKSNHLKIIKLYEIWSNYFGWWLPHLKLYRNLKLFWENYFGMSPHPQNNNLICPLCRKLLHQLTLDCGKVRGRSCQNLCCWLFQLDRRGSFSCLSDTAFAYYTLTGDLSSSTM